MALKGDLITAKEQAGMQYESATDMFEASNRPAGNTWYQSRRMGKLYCTVLISTWRSTGVKRKSFEVLFYFSEDTSFESVASLSSDSLRGNWSWLLNFCSFNKHGDICSNAVIFLEVKLKQTETTEK